VWKSTRFCTSSDWLRRSHSGAYVLASSTVAPLSFSRSPTEVILMAEERLKRGFKEKSGFRGREVTTSLHTSSFILHILRKVVRKRLQICNLHIIRLKCASESFK